MKYQTYLDWLKTQQTPMVDTLMRWSHINSGTFHTDGIRRMATELTIAYQDLGATVETIELAPYRQLDDRGLWQERPLGPLLRIRKRPQAKHQVLLCGHMDTVYPADHPFQSCRWIDTQTLNGPGVADMKGGLVVMLYALRALEESSLANNVGWQVIINPDEEIGSPSSAAIIAQAAANFSLGFVYEPALTAEGILAGQRKGSGKFSVAVSGRAAHVGRAFDDGHNAIIGLAQLINTIDKLNGQRPGVTINIGYCHGGGAVNIVPDKAICHIDIRTYTTEDETWFSQTINTIIKNFNQQSELHAECVGQFTRPPKLMDKCTTHLYEWAAKQAASLGLHLRWQATGGCCDGNNLSAAGLPNIDTLGVRGGAIHSDQEFTLVESLPERAQLTALLLFKLAKEKGHVGRTPSNHQ